MSDDLIKKYGHFLNQKVYSNQFGRTVNFNGHTSQVDLDDESNFFNSKIATDVFGASNRFDAD